MGVGIGFQTGFQIMSLVIPVMFLLALGIILVQIFRGIGQWNKNNHSPRLTVAAQVVAKRDHVTHRRHDTHTHRSTTYFVTFQVESGDRMELQMQGHEYGILVEGDKGNLTFQGTRYLGFERTV